MDLNPEILSEIKNAQQIDENTKAFLLWAVAFEKINLDKEIPRFKTEFLAQLDQIMSDTDNRID